MNRLSVKCVSFFALVTILGISLFTTPTVADCTYGTKDCRDGYWWICDKCGSENCWVYTGRKCELSQLESPPPEEARNYCIEQQTDLLVRVGCIDGKIIPESFR